MNVSIRREFVVDAPLERAWQHLARVEAWPSWAAGLKARFAVTEFVPKSHWKWISNFLGATIHYDHRFEPINHDRTKMQFIIEANDLGFGKFLLLKLYAAMYGKNLDKAIPNLVAEINAGMQ